MAKLKGRLPDFVPVFRETMNCPAWKALSFGAHVLYIALKARKAPRKNTVYLSYRDAVKELGKNSHRQILSWFSELEHYGFIVLEQYGIRLGTDGKGKSPLWRLTELPNENTGELATKDYLRWDGTKHKRKFKHACPYLKQGKRRPTVVKLVMSNTGGAVPDPSNTGGCSFGPKCTQRSTGSAPNVGAAHENEIELAHRFLKLNKTRLNSNGRAPE